MSPFRFLFLLFAFVHVIGVSQEWHPFNYDFSYYQSLNEVYLENPGLHISEDEVLSISLDSSNSAQNGTHHYPAKAFGCHPRIGEGCGSFDQQCIDHFSWIGNDILQSDSNLIIPTRFNDEVKLWIGTPDSFNIFENDSLVITAYLINQENINHFGVDDSISNYHLMVFDSNAAMNINHPFHGDTITIGKNVGFVKTPAWYLFPKVEAWFRLVDVNEEGRYHGFKQDALYNYHLNTIIQSRDHIETYSDGFKVAETITILQCTITNAEVFADSLLHTWSCVRQQDDYEMSESGGTNHESTYSSFERTTNHAELPNPFYRTPLKKHNAVFIDSELDRLPSVFHQFPSSGDCEAYHFITEGWGYKSTEEYAMGIGLYRSNWYEAYQYGNGTTGQWKVTYFNSVNQEYGTPGWPAGMEESVDKTISVYPNPSSGLIQINSQAPLSRIEIYDMSGARVKEKLVLHESSYELDLSNLSKGLYLIKVAHSNDTYSVKRVSLR